MELNDLMNVHNLTVVLVHNTVAADALKVFANRLVEYEEFIKDVNPPSQQVSCYVYSITTGMRSPSGSGSSTGKEVILLTPCYYF